MLHEQTEMTQTACGCSELQNYEDIKSKYEALLHEMKENTILESMNDMKVRYDELVKSTVSIYRYESLQQRYKELEQKHATLKDVFIAVPIMINHVSKLLTSLDVKTSQDGKLELYKAKLELCTIKDIVEDN